MTMTMMNLWIYVTTALYLLVWLAITVMAGITFLKNRRSPALAIQALGALSVFALGPLRLLILWLLSASASFDISRAAIILFQILQFLALAIFATGFCWEKIAQWRTKPLAAFPVS